MDRGLCWERNRCGKIASWRHSGNDWAGAGRYFGKLKMKDYQPESRKIHTRRCLIISVWVWAILQVPIMTRIFKWGWCRYSAGQAEQRWQTQLGDGHNLQNGTAAHEQVSAEADEASRIDTTGMEGRSQQLLWKRYEVWHNRIEGSGSRYTAHGWYCSLTCTHKMSRAFGDSWYCARNIETAARDFSTRM